VLVGAKEIGHGGASGVALGSDLQRSTSWGGVDSLVGWLSVDGFVEAPELVVLHVDAASEQKLGVSDLQVSFVISWQIFKRSLAKSCGHKGKTQ
jgi:hypothetical protein